MSSESRKWLHCMGKGHGRTVRWHLSPKSDLQLATWEPTALAPGCELGGEADKLIEGLLSLGHRFHCGFLHVHPASPPRG